MYLNYLIWIQLDLAAPIKLLHRSRESPAANLWLCASSGAVLKEDMIKAYGGVVCGHSVLIHEKEMWLSETEKI